MKKTKNGTVYCEEFSNSHDFVKDLTKEQREKFIEDTVKHYVEYWGGEKFEKKEYIEIIYENKIEWIVLIFKANTIRTEIMNKIQNLIKTVLKNREIDIIFECNFMRNSISMRLKEKDNLPF